MTPDHTAIVTGIERSLDVAENMISTAAWRARHARSSVGMPTFSDGLRRLARFDLGQVRARLDAAGPEDRARILARVDKLEHRLDKRPTTSIGPNTIMFCVAMVLLAMVACVARSCTPDDTGGAVLVTEGPADPVLVDGDGCPACEALS
jgi:hypothetical protein